jgi:hypothetical protein
MEMMEMLVQDFSYSAIVSKLNEKGFRQRNGQPWSRIVVFKMIPRLIEVGPQVFWSREWEKRREQFAQERQPEA